MIKFNKIYQIVGLAMFALGLAGCSDEWDSHYTESYRAEGSLWEAISSNPDLSNFASVVKACGYDASLGSSQEFTVFAPLNSDFSAEEAQALIDEYQKEKSSNVKDAENTTIKEFLQNHIALYNYSVSGSSNDSIVMMNGKYLMLTPTTFGGKGLASQNAVYGNGILFTLNNKLDYFSNVFEYMSKDAELDSVANFLNSYNKYEFDASKSVAGDIVDGKTVYLDSVTTLENDIISYLGKINSEDSSYWMVTPTNEVWNKYIPEYEQYFQYDKSTNKRDSLQWANSRLALLRGTVFSRTKNTDASVQDSAMSTNAVAYQYRKALYGSSDLKYYVYDFPYADGGVFNGTTNVECSNGQVMKASQWNIDKKQTFFQTIIAEGETVARLDSVDQTSTIAPLTYTTVSSSNQYYNKLSGNSYAEILPAGSSTNTKAVFNIPNVLSNIGYDIYVVTAPALAGDTLASDYERLPTVFRAKMCYNNENGAQLAERNWITLANNVKTTQDSIDVFKIGDNVKIPYCSYGLDTPQVKLIFETRVSNTNIRNGVYNRILRIDCIIFKPHEE